MKLILKENETMADVIGRLANASEIFTGIAPLAYWYENLHENGRIKDIFYSPHMRTILGFTDEEFPNTLEALVNAIHPDDVHIMLDNAIAAGTGKIDSYDVEYRIRTAAGNYLWVNATGQLVVSHDGVKLGMIGAFIDISAKKVVNENTIIRGFAEEYEAAVLVSIDDGTYRIISNIADLALPLQTKTLMSDVLSEYVKTYVHPDDVERFNPAMFNTDTAREWLTPGEVVSIEYRSCSKGAYEWYRLSFRRLNDNDGLVGFKNCDLEVMERQVSETLLNGYDAFYVVDLSLDTIMSPSGSKVSKVGNFKGKQVYHEMVRRFADTVSPAYQQDWVAFSDPQYMQQYMSTENHREYVYELPDTSLSMRRMTIDVLERVEGKATKVMFSFIGIDDQRAQALQLQRKVAEQAAFTNFFLGTYLTAYYIDFNDHTCQIYKLTERIAREYPVITDFVKSLLEYIDRDVHPDDREELRRVVMPEQMRRTLKEKGEYTHRFRDISGGVEKYYLMQVIYGADEDHGAFGFKDITEETMKERRQQQQLKEALEEAQAGERRSELLHQFMKAGEWSYGIDKNDEVVSAVYSNITSGVMSDQFVADPMSWVTLLHPDDREATVANFMAAIHDHSGQTPYDVTFRIKVKDGRYHWAKSSGRLLRHDDGTAELFGMNMDITDQIEERERQQQQLEEALAMAQSANRAKTTFLNNMSHDIRTPMNAIIGFTGLAASHIENKPLVQEYLGKIGQSSAHLLSLINDVLDMSRIESGKMNLDEKEEYLPDIIHTLRDIVQADIHAKQHDFFIDTVNVRDEHIVCDKLRLNQVLLNILSNAIKYTAAGGTLSMRITEKTVKPSGYATYEFRVKDNGMGMSEEFIQTMFDPFTRVKSSTISGIQGTGLGMAITKNIVDMMGGKIEVESTPGRGTEMIVTFDFRLASAPQETDVLPELQGLRGLVVDDDANTCMSIAHMLKETGMRDEWCTSGKEAVIRAGEAYQRGDLFKVYIIDWLMPDMNGIETTRRIRRVIGDDVPIIILTAYDWSDIEEEAREAGVTAFVSKPMFPSDLHRVLRSCLGCEGDEQQTEETPFDLTGHRVLLVEDNEMNREIATMILEEYGCQVFTAEDGDIAVEKMRTAAAGDYDLVLMDIQMPVMDGYEATRQIRALGTDIAKIPIIAMTANAFEEDRKLALAAGMDDHIAKPISIDQLKEVLARYI